MLRFAEGDFVENWEYGIGKIKAVNEESVTISFQGKADMRLPLDKTTYLKRLHQEGLLAQVYEDRERIDELIRKRSTEIIRMVIYDRDGKKTSPSEIKSSLTIGNANDRGWRKDFFLVSDADWKNWWAAVSKKLKKDPWFDASIKNQIILREEPLSETGSIMDRFLHDGDLTKKITMAEQLVKDCKKKPDMKVLEAVGQIIEKIIEGESDKAVVDRAVYCSAEIREMGIELKSFLPRAYELISTALVRNNLPGLKKRALYSTFTALPSHNIIDHLIIFLCGDEKLRKEISKHFPREKEFGSLAEKTVFDQPLTTRQIHQMNELVSCPEHILMEGIKSLVQAIDPQCVSNFLISLLLGENIESAINRTVAKAITETKSSNVIFRYFSEVIIPRENSQHCLVEFLNGLGAESAEITLRNVLLNTKMARERRNVFIQAYKYVASEATTCLNEKQRQRLLGSYHRF